MTTPADATSVTAQVVVGAPIERAFSVFTDDFGSFKPPEHNLLGVDIAETVFEPREGGHVYDRGVDGSECHWALPDGLSKPSLAIRVDLVRLLEEGTDRRGEGAAQLASAQPTHEGLRDPLDHVERLQGATSRDARPRVQRVEPSHADERSGRGPARWLGIVGLAEQQAER